MIFVDQSSTTFFIHLFPQFYKLTVYTAKPVSRGHLCDKKMWPYKTGDLLKEVQII